MQAIWKPFGTPLQQFFSPAEIAVEEIAVEEIAVEEIVAEEIVAEEIVAEEIAAEEIAAEDSLEGLLNQRVPQLQSVSEKSQFPKTFCRSL